MADYPYTPVTGKLRSLLQKIREVGKPAKVTNAWLKSIGFTSSNDPSLIPVLRYIRLIDTNGVPTSSWSDYRGAEHKVALATAIRAGYSQLFDIYPDAETRAQNDLENVVRSATTGGAQVVTKTVATFKALVAEADFQTPSKSARAAAAQEVPEATDPPLRSTAPAVTANNAGPQLHIDIQIHISSDASAKQIDQIFSSMAKHLYPTK